MAEESDDSDSINEDILKCPYSGQIIGRKLKEKIDSDIKKEKKSKKIDGPVIDLKDDIDSKPAQASP